MAVIPSPRFSSYCPCWTSASVLGCFGTGWLLLSSAMCFSSYFALSQSQSLGLLCLLLATFFCLPLALPLSCLPLACSSACCWLWYSACCSLCSSRFFSSLAPDLRCSSRCPRTLVALLHSSRHKLVSCGSVSDSHHWLWLWFRLCFFSRVTLWLFTATWFVSPTPLLSIAPLRD